MAKEEIIRKTGAYASSITTLCNIKFRDLENIIDGVIPEKYRNRITITFDVKGDNIINPQEDREYYSEPFDEMMTASEIVEWIADNTLDFIYAGKDDIAGYKPTE